MSSGCNWDYLQYGSTYNMLKFTAKRCGRYSFNYLYEYLWFVDWSAGVTDNVGGSTVYLRFVSDDTVHHKGFNMTFIAGSAPCKL